MSTYNRSRPTKPNQVTKNHCSYSFTTHKLKKKHHREEIVTISHFARCEIRCVISNVKLIRISCIAVSNDKRFNLHDNKHLTCILGELRESRETEYRRLAIALISMFYLSSGNRSYSDGYAIFIGFNILSTGDALQCISRQGADNGQRSQTREDSEERETHSGYDRVKDEKTEGELEFLVDRAVSGSYLYPSARWSVRHIDKWRRYVARVQALEQSSE